MGRTIRNIAKVAEAKEMRTIAFNKEHYGDLIRTHRIKQGLTQAQLAQNLRVQGAYITHWETGRTRPDLNLIPELCRELGISIASFFNAPASLDHLPDIEQKLLVNYRRVSEHDRKIIDITLSNMAEMAMEEDWDYCRTQFHLIYRNYQRAAAGTGVLLDPQECGEQIYVRNTRISDQADEIVTVSGDSMEPAFHNGQEVYVRHTNDLKVGEIGLFVINGDGFIKEFRGNYLHSLNPEYSDIHVGEFDEMTIVGKVLGIVGEGDYPTIKEQSMLDEIEREKGGKNA